MRRFHDLYDIAAARKGGTEALEALLEPPPPAAQVAAIPGDRWLAGLTRGIFNAGFNWKVVEAMWPGFEAAFRGFDVGACAMMDDAWFDALLADRRIVRHGPKIEAVRDNAVFLSELAAGHGGAGAFFAGWPAAEYAGLLDELKRRGSRLGGTTGQYVMRAMGVDGFILSRDVVARLQAEGVIEGAPGSKTSMRAIQGAFNAWRAESGRSLKEISRILAMSIG